MSSLFFFLRTTAIQFFNEWTQFQMVSMTFKQTSTLNFVMQEKTNSVETE